MKDKAPSEDLAALDPQGERKRAELDYPAVAPTGISPALDPWENAERAMFALQHCVYQPEVDRTQVFTWIKTNWNKFAVVDKRLVLNYVRDLFYNTKLIELGHSKQSLIQFMDLWTWIQKQLIESEELFDLEELKKDIYNKLGD